MFNIAKSGFLKDSGGIPAWDFSDSGTNRFRLLFVGGGALNGLDAAGAEDADTLAALASVATYQFNGTGYTPGGELVSTRTITTDDTNDRAEFDAADNTVATLAAGTSNGTTITHLLLTYQNGAVLNTLGTYIPILCIDLGQTYTGTGSSFTVAWDADGIFTLT